MTLLKPRLVVNGISKSSHVSNLTGSIYDEKYLLSLIISNVLQNVEKLEPKSINIDEDSSEAGACPCRDSSTYSEATQGSQI